jgi:hypothetical protein
MKRCKEHMWNLCIFHYKLQTFTVIFLFQTEFITLPLHVTLSFSNIIFFFNVTFVIYIVLFFSCFCRDEFLCLHRDVRFLWCIGIFVIYVLCYINLQLLFIVPAFVSVFLFIWLYCFCMKCYKNEIKWAI